MKEFVRVRWVNATYIDVALHPLCAAEHYARRSNRSCVCNSTKHRKVQYCFYLPLCARMIPGLRKQACAEGYSW